MTDITELAQRMKAAAVRAKAATEDYVAHHMSITVYLEECKEFNDLSDGPDNILALVEALEKAQAEVKRQENIASALFDEVSQLRRNADDKAPELKKIITEMEEENNRQVLEVMRLSSLVAELESRTVTVKMPDYADNGVGETWGDGFNSGIDSTCDAFRSALTADGIKWEAE